MILNTGSRTDIPAYYSKWFMNRVREGFVLVRNPFDACHVTRYETNPEIVDILAFCTKNPAPMLQHLEELKKNYRMIWHVTITPYGKDIEPNVPDKHHMLQVFQSLSRAIGKDACFWRYDPVFISDKYSIAYHMRAFETMCSALEGFVSIVVVSFIDLYEKTKRNFPEVHEVSLSDQETLAQYFQQTASRHGMKVHVCMENASLSRFGVDTSGCFTQQLLERATHVTLNPPFMQRARPGCACLLSADIGAYNTCGHFCRYCYANYDKETVMRNMSLHDANSPLLIGHLEEGDKIFVHKGKSWLDRRMRLEL